MVTKPNRDDQRKQNFILSREKVNELMFIDKCAQMIPRTSACLALYMVPAANSLANLRPS